MIDEFNARLSRLAVAAGVALLDNTPVVGPMWDSASDYKHPHGVLLRVLGARLVNRICSWYERAKGGPGRRRASVCARLPAATGR